MTTYATLVKLCRSALDDCKKGDIASEAYVKEIIRQVGVLMLGENLCLYKLGHELDEVYGNLVEACETRIRDMSARGADIGIKPADINYLSELLRRSRDNAPRFLLRRGYKRCTIGDSVHRAREDLLRAAASNAPEAKARNLREAAQSLS
ncbi:MAG: hypothetical protein QW548_01110 [Candidatus Aenigmatarchaeota archaeon]